MHVIPRSMTPRLLWRNDNRSYELRTATSWASPDDYINGWLSAGQLLFFLSFFFEKQCFSFNWGQWPLNHHWAPQITVRNVGGCRRQQTTINAQQTCSFQTKGEARGGGGGGGGRGGWQAVTDTDHLTLAPPDGLSRHNNITPRSTRVKQVRACHSLTSSREDVNVKRRLTAHVTMLLQTPCKRNQNKCIICDSSYGFSGYQGSGWPTSHMFVT